MKAKLAKLIDVKSIMTLLLTLGFFVLAMCGRITAEQYITIFTVIVGFYFGTQSGKKSEDKPAVRVNTEAIGTVPEDTEHIPLTVEDSVVQAVHPPNM